MNLEDKLIGKLHSAQEIDEEELLIVLGASEDKIPEYKTKLDLLEAEFEVYMEANDIPYHDAKKLALGLRDFLWKDKKNRSTRDFLLPDVIDTELANKEEKVRHCVGSTAKYWVLGSRFGLKQSVLLSPSHIYSRVILDDKSTRTLLDLENTRASGKINFDNYFDTKEFGIEGLLVATLLNRADQKNKEGNFLGALDDYNQAAKFEALKDESFYNKAILKYTHGYYEDALEDINKALELNYNWINNSNFHYNKGLILLELKKSEEALECFEKAIGINNQEFEESKKPNEFEETNEKNIDCFVSIVRAKKQLKKFEEAIADYSWLMIIDEKNKPHYLMERGKLKTQAGLQDIDGAIKLNPKLENIFLK